MIGVPPFGIERDDYFCTKDFPSESISIVILPMRTGGGDDLFMKFWTWKQENLPSITHAIRTAVAATVSVVIARLVQMPEAYWAAIATLVVMQSTLGATLTLSLDWIVATDIGASGVALEAKQKSKTVKVEMISIGVIITPTHYSSADCTAIARGRCLLLPLSRQDHRQQIEQRETKVTKFLSIRVESIRAFWLCHPGD